VQEYRPFIITTFNGDFFDLPFLLTRAQQNGLSFEEGLAMAREEDDQYFYGRYVTHLDCMHWVVRDSYLPHGR
jgi:DNA polymerase epsilon subunit 1